MRWVGEPIPRSRAVSDNAAAAVFVEETGYPVIVRAAYTLGGSGSGIAHTAEELERIVGLGIAYSRIKQVLVEEAVPAGKRSNNRLWGAARATATRIATWRTWTRW